MGADPTTELWVCTYVKRLNAIEYRAADHAYPDVDGPAPLSALDAARSGLVHRTTHRPRAVVAWRAITSGAGCHP